VTATLTRPEAAHERSVELVLAHAHLRLGSLALARTELETLAGLGKLDTTGLIDLAEVRWRTGDLAGAGEAAAVALRGNDEHPVALLIAAEAAASLGRPSESRRLASRAMALARGSIDTIFAGMPRSAAWPPDGDEPPPTAPTLFDRAAEAPGRAELPELAGRGSPSAVQAAAAVVVPAQGPMTLGLWDDEPAEEPNADDLFEPALELEAGRTALVAGRFDEAVLHFGLALRIAPALAPAVLEATAGSRAPSLLMIRGDAYRLAGHEGEARDAYLAAARGGLPERRRRPRTRPVPVESSDGTKPAAEAGESGDGPEAPPASEPSKAGEAREGAETDATATDATATDAAQAGDAEATDAPTTAEAAAHSDGAEASEETEAAAAAPTPEARPKRRPA
jgi:tetratricopeptide (TPR) repeat protein